MGSWLIIIPKLCLEPMLGEKIQNQLCYVNLNMINRGLMAGDVWAKLWPAQKDRIYVASSLYKASVLVTTRHITIQFFHFCLLRCLGKIQIPALFKNTGGVNHSSLTKLTAR